MPMLASNYIPEDIEVVLQSENGVLGLVCLEIHVLVLVGSFNIIGPLS